ncbi:MAG: hypothetical protein ACTTHG_05310 [Treponemataceae bacterium]
MRYDVKKLKLYEDLKESELSQFLCAVKQSNLTPDIEDFLINEEKVEIIPAGEYFFVQHILSSEKAEDEKIVKDLLNNMAEAIYLEALWLEVSHLADITYKRKLKEGNGTVFQLFRKL